MDVKRGEIGGRGGPSLEGDVSRVLIAGERMVTGVYTGSNQSGADVVGRGGAWRFEKQGKEAWSRCML